MELVSVIVPVYNVEKYLARCIQSVCGQSYQGLEIILVDDGSKDKSGVICDEYAERDGRIKVIHKENGGLGDARNAGVEKAEGGDSRRPAADALLQRLPPRLVPPDGAEGRLRRAARLRRDGVPARGRGGAHDDRLRLRRRAQRPRRLPEGPGGRAVHRLLPEARPAHRGLPGDGGAGAAPAQGGELPQLRP